MSFYLDLNNASPYALPEELTYLRQEAFKLKGDDEIVIIGAGPCVMAGAMLEGHPDPPFCSIIDILPLNYCEEHLKIGKAFGSHINLIEGDSFTVGFGWPNKINLLVVDGDHSYSGVSKDIKAWWNRVHIGGLVFFHDYLTREDGFNGKGEWERGDVALAIELYRDSSWVLVNQVGISVVYMRV